MYPPDYIIALRSRPLGLAACRGGLRPSEDDGDGDGDDDDNDGDGDGDHLCKDIHMLTWWTVKPASLARTLFNFKLGLAHSLKVSCE